uniref:Uncharacterized protein n=1 Tax=Globisporangium ultimum (strain ATCC 200006 / CBS 805.95 / DAOM BR144) TaxID=431595 RepID=K3X9I2_GLOUD
MTTSYDLKGMHRKEWIVTSATPLQVLHVTVPGVVFVDCEGEDNAASSPRPVARIVVTSDSLALLALLEVAPPCADSDKLSFRVKNEHQIDVVEGAILTEIFVYEKASLRELHGCLSAFVLGDDVLVHNDPDADVKLVATNTEGVYITSAQGFFLKSLEMSHNQGSGMFQLQAPSIEAKNRIAFSVGSSRMSSMAIVVPKEISAGESMLLLAGKASRLHVDSQQLKTKMLMIWSVQSGVVKVIGSGSATNQAQVFGWGGTIDTSAIVSETASVAFVWSGNSVVRATKKLNSNNFGFGSASVEYVRDRPATISSRDRWLCRHPRVFYREGEDPTDQVTERQHYEPPLRKPKTVRIRVTKPYFGKELHIEKVESFSPPNVSRVTLLAGAVTFAAIAFLAARRK